MEFPVCHDYAMKMEYNIRRIKVLKMGLDKTSTSLHNAHIKMFLVAVNRGKL